MIPDIFSIFDPHNNQIISLSSIIYWLIAFFPISLINRQSFLLTNRILSLQYEAISVALAQSNQTATYRLKIIANFIIAIFI